MDENSGLLQTAGDIRRGVVGLHRRLRIERPSEGLPLAQLSVLGHLNRTGPMTPSELASADRLQPQSLTRVLAELEEAHLVTRRQLESDRRRSVIVITEGGVEAVVRDMSHWDTWLAAALAEELSPTERSVLRLAGHLMERLAGASVNHPPFGEGAGARPSAASANG